MSDKAIYEIYDIKEDKTKIFKGFVLGEGFYIRRGVLNITCEQKCIASIRHVLNIKEIENTKYNKLIKLYEIHTYTPIPTDMEIQKYCEWCLRTRPHRVYLQSNDVMGYCECKNVINQI